MNMNTGSRESIGDTGSFLNLLLHLRSLEQVGGLCDHRVPEVVIMSNILWLLKILATSKGILNQHK